MQAGINLQDLRLVQIPTPEQKAQQYIGDKVRHAERLRAVADCLAGRSLSIIAATLPSDLPPNFRDQPRRITSRFVTATSLNPEHRAHIWRGTLDFGTTFLVRDLVDDCKCGDPIREDDRVPGDYWYYGASGPIDRHNEFNFEGEYLIVAQDGTIGCAWVAQDDSRADNHVWILKVKEEFDPDAIAMYLDRFYPFWQGMTTSTSFRRSLPRTSCRS